MSVRACVCILCRSYQLCLRHAVPNEHIRPASVCDEQQTSLQWLAVAGQCGRHTCGYKAHTQNRICACRTSQSGFARCFSADSDKDSVVCRHVRLSVRKENRAAQTVNYQMTELFYHWKGADEQSNSQWATELRTRLLCLSTQDMFLTISAAL